MPKAKPKKPAKKKKVPSPKKKKAAPRIAKKAAMAAAVAAAKPKKRSGSDDPLADLPEEESETKAPASEGPGYPEIDDFLESDEDEEDFDGKGGADGEAWSGDDEY